MTLDEIRKLIDEATPGPWNTVVLETSANYFGATCPFVGPKTFQDARFIAAARTLLPALLDVVAVVKDFNCCCGGVGCDQDRDLQRSIAALEALELP